MTSNVCTHSNFQLSKIGVHFCKYNAKTFSLKDKIMIILDSPIKINWENFTGY